MRYNVLATVNETLFTVNSVVVPDRYQILYDNENNKTVARIAFSVNGDRKPMSVTFDVRCLDVSGNLLGESKDLTLFVAVDDVDVFGKDKLYDVPDQTASLQVVIKEIRFADGEIWQTDAPVLRARKTTKDYLSGEFAKIINKELETLSAKCDNDFVDYGDYWTCTCGQLNSGDSCVCCGVNKVDLAELFDQNNLIEKRKQRAYSKILKSFQQATTIEQFEECIKKFESLEGYGDSEQMIERCRDRILDILKKDYDSAVAAQNLEALKECKKQFESRKDVYDVEKIIIECDAQIKIIQEKNEKRLKTIAKILGISALSIFVLVILITCVFVPLGKTNKAEKALDNGDPIAAIELYKSAANFSNGYKKAEMLDAILNMNGGIYDKQNKEFVFKETLVRIDKKVFDDNVVELLNRGIVVTVEIDGYEIVADWAATFDDPTRYNMDVPTAMGYAFKEWIIDDMTIDFRKGYNLTIKISHVWTLVEYTVEYVDCDINNPANPTAYTIDLAEEGIVLQSPPIRMPEKRILDSESGATEFAVYDFDGWYADNSYQIEKSVINVGDGNVTVYAKWNKTSVTVYKNILGAGTCSAKIDEDEQGKRATLSAETNVGYTWLGWYDGDTKVSDDLQYTFVMPSENKIYTAKFVLCISHTLDASCVCTACGQTLHNLDANCVCIVCGTTVHGVNGAYCRHGDYIYFGTYPQTKVTDSATLTALNNKRGTLPTSANAQTWTDYGYYINGSVQSYMWYKDVELNGARYRGVYFTSYRPYYSTNSSSTGYTYQDDNGYTTGNVYWFAYEPIKWRILETSDGIATILCELAIDSQEYYSSDSSGTFSHNGGTGYANNYELSNIRKWLNDTFYNTAFNDMQKSIIQLTTVDNSARSTNPNNNATQWNSGNNSYACANTNDKIFLLSEQEVTNAEYGFNASYSNYDTERRKQSTDYAKSQGCWASTSSSYLGNCYWWLRSPGYHSSNSAWGVDYLGTAYDYRNVPIAGGGVVPALRIRL